MSYIKAPLDSTVKLKLKKNINREIKQGYPWIFSESLTHLPEASTGSRAIVRDTEGAVVACGIYDPKGPIAVRICAVENEQLNDDLIIQRLFRAFQTRRTMFDKTTTGYRLCSGEGDGLPGLVIDVYNTTAVFRLDGDAPAAFWHTEEIARWLTEHAEITTVYERYRSEKGGRYLIGTPLSPLVEFLENNIRFKANIVEGQKTGFFFDQRDNRKRFAQYTKNKTVLNLFGYTGGFSIYAEQAGASHVTTVDSAGPAIQLAHENWNLNNHSPHRHRGEINDVFAFLEQAKLDTKKWDCIVVDPPSFAKANDQIEQATASYLKLFVAAIDQLTPGGVIALSSCSRQIAVEPFINICRQAFSKARRRATVLGIYGQPEDHPFPLACEELRYLKFVLLRDT